MVSISTGVKLASLGLTAAISLPALVGFGAAGVGAGTTAAAYQSAFYGGFTPAAGVFATLTSIGMQGIPALWWVPAAPGVGAVVKDGWVYIMGPNGQVLRATVGQVARWLGRGM